MSSCIHGEYTINTPELLLHNQPVLINHSKNANQRDTPILVVYENDVRDAAILRSKKTISGLSLIGEWKKTDSMNPNYLIYLKFWWRINTVPGDLIYENTIKILMLLQSLSKYVHSHKHQTVEVNDVFQPNLLFNNPSDDTEQ